MSEKIIILGGGLAGLRLAYKLLPQGFAVEIFERERQIGGLMQTFHEDDLYLDYGPHIYHAHLLPDLRGLLGEDILPVDVVYGVGFKGKIITTPVNVLEVLRTLSPQDSLALVWDALCTRLWPRKQAQEVQSAEDWGIRQFGRVGYSYFFKDYIPKVTSAIATMVSADWGKERHRFYQEHNLRKSPWQLFAAAVRHLRNKREKLRFYYPAKGAHQIVAALADAIREMGGVIHLNTAVQEVRLTGKKIQAVCYQENGKAAESTADWYANTLPLSVLGRILKPPQEGLAEMAQRLSYRSLWLFYLMLTRDHLTEKAQIYFPEKEYIFKRLYEPKSLNPRLGRPGQTGICVEVGYSPGDAIDRKTEEEVYVEVLSGLERFFGLRSTEVSKWWSKRLPYVYAIYQQGYDRLLQQFAEFMFTIPNFISFGRQGSFRYNFLGDRVIEAADETARFLLSGQSKAEFLGQPQAKSWFF